MTRNERGRGLSLVSAFVILSTLWFAAPHASQEGANEGFILFSTDRDSTVRDDPSSEEIYVMLPPTGDRIAFHRQIAGHLQVHTMNSDGTGVTQITLTATAPLGFSGFPSWGKWSATR